MPDHAGVRVGPREVAGRRIAGLPALGGDRLRRIGAVEHNFAAEIAPLRGIDAPQMTGPFTVLRTAARHEVNAVLINRGRGDERIAVSLAPLFPARSLGIGVELPEERRFSAGDVARVEAIDPAIASAE